MSLAADLPGGFFHTNPGRRQGQGLGGLLALQPLLDVAMDLGDRPAVQPQPAADQHGAGRGLEGAVAEGPRPPA